MRRAPANSPTYVHIGRLKACARNKACTSIEVYVRVSRIKGGANAPELEPPRADARQAGPATA